MPKYLTTVLLGALFTTGFARANPITFDFTGAVTQVPIDDLATGIQSGDSISGSFTFDSTAVDAIAAPTSASYTSTGAAFGMTVSVGAVTFSESGFLNIGILNTFVDQYTVLASSPLLTLDLFFQDNTGTAFSSDALPLSPPPLAGFLQREFHLDEIDVAGDETQADGIIDSLTCGSGCVASSSAPEPSSTGLLFTGAILLAGWRSKIHQKSKIAREK